MIGQNSTQQTVNLSSKQRLAILIDILLEIIMDEEVNNEQA